MKNFIKYFAIIGIIASGLACEKKSSNGESQPTSAPAAELSPSPNVLAAEGTVAPPAATPRWPHVLMSQILLGDR